MHIGILYKTILGVIVGIQMEVNLKSYIHPKHCSQKYKLLQYINYPINETKKTTIAMDTLKIHDVISLIILSRDMDLLNFSIFFENYLIKKNTNAAAINSLTPDLSNL